MENKANRARIVALGILLVFTVTVYFGWRASQDYQNATNVEHVRQGITQSL
jgi:hypothetical protein